MRPVVKTPTSEDGVKRVTIKDIVEAITPTAEQKVGYGYQPSLCFP